MALELMGQGIDYLPRTAIKSQVPADFVAEWTEVQAPPTAVDHEYWKLLFDGSITKKGARGGWVLVSPLGVRMQYALQLNFPASHNVAEYEALVNGMHVSVELGIKRLEAFGDSQLVVDQVMNESNCTNPKMAAYCAEVRRLQEKFDGFQVSHVPQRDNEAADSLAKIASYREKVSASVFCSDQNKLSIREIIETSMLNDENSHPNLDANPGANPAERLHDTLVHHPRHWRMVGG